MVGNVSLDENVFETPAHCTSMSFRFRMGGTSVYCKEVVAIDTILGFSRIGWFGWLRASCCRSLLLHSFAQYVISAM